MRIALLTSFFPPSYEYGISRYVEDLAFCLIKNSVDVTVIASDSKFSGLERRRSLDVYWIKCTGRRSKVNLMPSFFFVIASFKIRKKLKQLHKIKPFDIIEFPNTEFTGLASVILKLPDPQPKFITRLSSPKSLTPRSNSFPRLSELLEKIQTKQSNAVISNSHENYLKCREIYNLSNEQPSVIIYHGLPAASIRDDTVISKENQKNILFLGRMNIRKGFDVLASAWPEISKELPDCNLLVAGEDLSFDNESSFFAWAVRDMPFAAMNKMTYYGVVSNEDRDLLYTKADLIVVPSRYESFGLVLLEAMQHRIPIISTDVGGIPEIIKHQQTGLLVPPDDPSALKSAIIDFFNNYDQYTHLTQNAFKELSTKFSIDRVTKESIKFYYSLIKN